MDTARASLLRLVLLAAVTAAPALAHADAPPRLISAPTVDAPEDGSLPAGASVVLLITVDATGAVSEVEVAQGVRPDVDERVVAATRQMRFTPAERGGQAVPARMRFRFRLRAAAGPATGAGASAGAGTAGESGTGAGTGGATAGGVAGSTTTTQGSGAGTNATASGAGTAIGVPQNPYAAGAAGATGTAGAGTGRRGRGRGGPLGAPLEQGITVRARGEPGAATRESFRAEELTTVPGTFGEPTRIVASLPGVARTPFGLGFFVVRGASFENTGFFVDGFPVLILYHLAAGPAVISSRLVGQLDFYPGGYPLQFGRFSAGVISLETRPPPTDRPRIELEVDALRASALGVVPTSNGRGSVALAFRRSYYDLLLPLIQPGVIVNYTDGQIRGDYRFSERVRGSIFMFGSSDTFDRSEVTGQGATAATARDGLRYNFGRAIARLEYRGDRGLLALWSGMVGYDETDVIQTDPGQEPRRINLSGGTVGQRISVRVPTGPLTTTLGIDALGYAYDANVAFSGPSGFGAVPMPGSNPRVLQARAGVAQFGIAAYVEEVLRTGRFEFTGGARLEYLAYGGNQYLVADPRVVSRVRVLNFLTVIASTGLFHQPPPFFSLIPGAGNPDLLPQRAWQTSVGVEATLPLGLEGRITGFYNRMWQLPRASYGTIETNGSQSGMGSAVGASRAIAVSDGEGEAFGMELLIRRRIAQGIYGWLSYTLSRSERFIGNGPRVPFTFDQTHVLNLAASWDINRTWRVGARFQLATGSPTSRVYGAIFDANTDGFRPQYIAEADRLPTYHQLDVRVDYNFRLGPLYMSAFLDILNVYYAQTAEGYVYQYDYMDRRPRPGLPILPTVGIRGQL